MLAILAITLPVFLVIGVGYWCGKIKLLPAETQRILSLFVFYCSLPSYLFVSMAKVPKALILNPDYILAFACAMAGIAFLGWLVVRHYYPTHTASRVLGTMASCHTNSVLIGVPIIVGAYGSPAPVVVVTLFQVIVATTIILTVIEAQQEGKPFAFLNTVKTIFRNPIVGASFLGIACAWNEWPLPVVLEKGCELLGSACIPTALFALGLSLSQPKAALNAQTRPVIYSLVMLKCFAHPALAWLVGTYVFHLQDPWLGSLIIVSAMPTAVNNFTFSQRYGAFVEESTHIVFMTSIITFFTLSALLLFLPGLHHG
ncbi:MAG: AEC family transporter [Alphaproteobacteria bacterium]|nr:AEC family transporter [Alphaproteobacteria bacterium]